MSNPSDHPITWREILKVNMQAAGGILALSYGWICWEMASPEFWGFWIAGILGFAGGAFQMIAALYKTGSFILGHRQWRALQTQGTTPRADHQPDRKDFKDGGMIR